MSDSRIQFEKAFPIPAHWIEFDEKRNKYVCQYNAIDHHLLIYQAKWEVWQERQSEIDQLKAKKTALVHALVNTNAEKSKWASDYWKQVERTAEYGSMLISSDSELAVSCFKKEKEVEKLKAEKAGLLRLAVQWREQSKELCRVDDKYVIGSLLGCAEQLEEAVRGGHE